LIVSLVLVSLGHVQDLSAETFDTGWKRPAGKFNYSGVKKIVVHFNSSANEVQLKRMVHSFQQMREEAPKLDVKLVVHGEALKVFKEANGNDVYKQFVDEARKSGVKFLICHNSLINMKTKVSELYSIEDSEVVPAAIPEIAKLKSQGYAYIRYF
jgi:intracellular sulfur oxidation DsrE/DsrF family protein